MRRVIRMNLADNVYTALADFEAGDMVQVVSEIQEGAQEVVLTTIRNDRRIN
jgi:hypothetical protein